ncbi:exosortase F system-associated protein [Aequorivita sp. Q41]|uniref:exosortase F system-associated membrane protein n=1 Tax=Aequorivita sp. Q41 TaxID=3153300 RepID=UPI0032426ADA
MKRLLTIGIILLLAILLVLIRAFENSLFYDPLLVFFKGAYKTAALPKMDVLALHFGVFLRFFMNTIISIAILWVVFKNKEVVKISALLYCLLFFIFFIVFGFIIFTSEEVGGHLILFYVRRFLIQPLFLLILLPAFYFQKYKSH